QIKQIFGVNINPSKDSSIAVANKLLNLFDRKLVCVGWAGGRANKHRVYQLAIPDDAREAILDCWLERDRTKYSIEQLAS
ncbi:MAG: hypothetical protein ACRC11_16455, partial [Xenococcaceae cyanobacterium]